MKIDILLSTYNGEKFIKEQLDSLLGQTFQGWRLLVRDDGSSDCTVKIVEEYMSRYPAKIIFVEDKRKHLGAGQSFAKLMEYSYADYIMFCDQDDVWLEGKIEATLAKMKEIEITAPVKPILVHTDLKIADENLKVISNSMWKYQKLEPKRKSINYLLVQNNVTGCTVMINKRLKEITLPFPEEAIIHDWWLALVSSAFGKIGYVNIPTILYRQHGKNDIGAKKYSLEYLFSKVKNKEDAKKVFYKTTEQAGAFLKKFEGILDKEKKDMLKCFSSITVKGKMERFNSIIKYKFMKSGFLRNIGYIGFLLCQKGNR